MIASRFIKDNLALVAGIAVPIILVAGFMLTSTLGKWLTPPPAYTPYFVIQTTAVDAPSHLAINVDKEGRLRATLTPRSADDRRNTVPARVDVLLAYDTRSGMLQEHAIDIPGDKTSGSFAPANLGALRLSRQQYAADGYAVVYGYGGRHSLASDIFINNGAEGFRLRKGSAVYRLPDPASMPMQNNNGYYAYNLRFLGWTTEKTR